MERFIKIVLYVNALIALFVGIFVYAVGLVPADPAVASSPALARTIAGWELGWAVLATFVVARMFTRDPRWLLIPIAFLAFLTPQAVYELFVTPGAPVPPAILRSLFLAIYAIGFVVLSRRASRTPTAAPSRAYEGAR